MRVNQRTNKPQKSGGPIEKNEIKGVRTGVSVYCTSGAMIGALYTLSQVLYSRFTDEKTETHQGLP